MSSRAFFLHDINSFYAKSQVFRSFFLGYVRNILHFCWVYANLATEERPYSIQNDFEQSLSTDLTDGETSNPMSNLVRYF